jgi:hypothetical protein
VAPRTRILAFGCAAVLVLAGGACAAFAGGIVGEVLTIVLISAGLAGGLLLIFLEIGLEEERDLAREQASRRERARAGTLQAGQAGERRSLSIRGRPWLRRPPRRPS